MTEKPEKKAEGVCTRAAAYTALPGQFDERVARYEQLLEDNGWDKTKTLRDLQKEWGLSRSSVLRYARAAKRVWRAEADLDGRQTKRADMRKRLEHLAARAHNKKKFIYENGLILEGRWVSDPDLKTVASALKMLIELDGLAHEDSKAAEAKIQIVANELTLAANLSDEQLAIELQKELQKGD